MRVSFSKDEVKEFILKQAHEAKGEQILFEMDATEAMQRYLKNLSDGKIDDVFDEIFEVGRRVGYMESKLESMSNLRKFFKIGTPEE